MHVFSKLITPSSGKSITGKSDVMAMGTHSVIHQMSIQPTTPNTFIWAGSKPNGLNAQSAPKSIGPSSKEK